MSTFSYNTNKLMWHTERNTLLKLKKSIIIDVSYLFDKHIPEPLSPIKAFTHRKMFFSESQLSPIGKSNLVEITRIPV